MHKQLRIETQQECVLGGKSVLNLLMAHSLESRQTTQIAVGFVLFRQKSVYSLAVAREI